MENKLKKSGVIYDPIEHTYTLNGKQLSGITGIISRQLFADEMAAIPEKYLKAAAERGSDFHDAAELFINTGIMADGNPMFDVFLKHYSHINFIASEYVVTDFERIASPIDAIDNKYVLYDFKTSTSKDIEKWRWQLSTYRWLFKEVNGFYPTGLKVLWINKDLKHDLIDIEPIDETEVKRLYDCEFLGEKFMPTMVELPEIDDNKYTELAVIEKRIVEMEESAKELAKQRDKIKDAILDSFMKNNVKKWETDNLVLTVKDPYQRTTFDSKRFQTDHPEMYGDYTKTSTIKESLLIKLKN